MSSNPGSSDSWDKIDSASQFSVPCCTMCVRKEVSKSYCSTCKHYLCFVCACSHKMMICFSTHRIHQLDDVENVEALEKVLQTAESDSDSPVECLGATVRELTAWQFWAGSKYVDSLSRMSYELGQSLDLVAKFRNETIQYVDGVCRRYEYLLKTQRDQIVEVMNGEFGRVESALLKERGACELKTNEALAALSNLSLVECNGFKAGEADNGIFPVFEGDARWGFDFLDDHIAEAPADLNLSRERQAVSLDGTDLSYNNVFPHDSFDIPIEPTNSKCYVNSNLSLPTVDPDSLPNSHLVKTMQIHKTFGQKGNTSGQFHSPHGFCLGFDEDIVVADSSNHRVQIFDKTGQFKSQFGVAGRHDGYLWHPRKVAVLPRQRRYVVCDRGYNRSRMQIFTESGKFVKTVFIQFIDIVAGVAVTATEDIVVVDSVTPTVFILGQNDFFRSIDCVGLIEEPSDICVAGKEFYICDFKSHAIVVINDEGTLLRKFGDKRTTMFPNGIDLSMSGYVLIGDSHGNFFHIVVYKSDGTFVAELRCPYVKVSRCCGLKITGEGRIVTVDKNYHHVIVLEALALEEE